MKNDKDHAVWVGTTRDDEMCNFYLMYWMHGPKNLDQGWMMACSYVILSRLVDTIY